MSVKEVKETPATSRDHQEWNQKAEHIGGKRREEANDKFNY